MKRWLLISFLLHICGVVSIHYLKRTTHAWDKVSMYKVSLVTLPNYIKPEKEETDKINWVSESVKPVNDLSNKPLAINPKSKVTPVSEKTKTDSNVTATKGSALPQIRIEGASFPFTYYLNLIRFRIQENWSPPYRRTGGAEKRTAQVVFNISKEGRVSGIFLEKETGYYLFDQAAIRAVFNSGSFPPLPGNFPDDKLRFHVEFEAIP